MHLFRYGPTPEIRREHSAAQEPRQHAGAISTAGQGSGKLAEHLVQEVPVPDTMQAIRDARINNLTQQKISPTKQQENTLPELPQQDNERQGLLAIAGDWASHAISLATEAAGVSPLPLTQEQKDQEREEMVAARLAKFLQQPSETTKQGALSDSTSSSSSAAAQSIIAPASERAISHDEMIAPRISAEPFAASAAAVEKEDDDTIAARRFALLDERQAQPARVISSISDYTSRRNDRIINAVVRGEAINNNEAIDHNERMEQFAPRVQQLAAKAIEFTKVAINFAEEGSTLGQPVLHSLARRYDDLAATADAGVADFKTRLSQETISDRDLNEVIASYQELAARAESLEENKNYAEKGIQFSRVAQSGSSSASELDATAVSILYNRLADYCFRMISSPNQITDREREHYDLMIDLASQALKARCFRRVVLTTALEKNIQMHEALARCTTRMEQSSDPAVKDILSQALVAHRAAKSSRNTIIKEQRSELERTKILAAATTHEESERAELVNKQNEEYKKSDPEELQASSSRSVRATSPAELMANADGYDQVAQSLEQTATYQEAIHALPDVPSKVKGQKTFKEKAQGFLEKAQTLYQAALEQLQKNDGGPAEDSLARAKIELERVSKSVEAARQVASKPASAGL